MRVWVGRTAADATCRCGSRFGGQFAAVPRVLLPRHVFLRCSDLVGFGGAVFGVVPGAVRCAVRMIGPGSRPASAAWSRIRWAAGPRSARAGSTRRSRWPAPGHSPVARSGVRELFDHLSDVVPGGSPSRRRVGRTVRCTARTCDHTHPCGRRTAARIPAGCDPARGLWFRCRADSWREGSVESLGVGLVGWMAVVSRGIGMARQFSYLR